MISIRPVEGLPEIGEGDDLAALIAGRAGLEDGDVLVVAQKAVSKAEGRVVRLDELEPSERARELAGDEDPRRLEAILRETARIVRARAPLVIAETRHGFVCASAGVDSSNAPGPETVVLLPLDPDASAAGLRERLRPGEVDCRDRLEAGGEGGTEHQREGLCQRAGLEPRDDPGVGEAQVARDAEHRSLADLLRQLRARLERRVRFGREHDQVDPAHDLVVAATLDAELETALDASPFVAGADEHFLAQQVQPPCERAAEGAGAADDRNLHRSAAAVSSTASATRRRSSPSSISVRVTIRRTSASSSASASSITNASSRPL